ncbi:MAG: hypothetical protein KF878_05040 [Planctomycetes bacterium]|nr:hypothetical protein [Planctomycetota bacterium]
MTTEGDEGVTLLRPATRRRAAWTILQSGLMVLIALQAGAVGGVAAYMVGLALRHGRPPDWALAVAAATAGAIGVAVSGRLVLGTWRAGARALAVAAVGVAAAVGTFHSPILAERLGEHARGLAAGVAMFGAAAIASVGLLVLAPPPGAARSRPEPPAA